MQSLTDVAVLQLCTVASGPFFVDNVGELQLQSIKLLSAIFCRYESFRKSIIQVSIYFQVGKLSKMRQFAALSSLLYHIRLQFVLDEKI